MMKIACLAENRNHVSLRYRTEQYVSRLEQEGIVIDFVAVPRPLAERLRFFGRLRSYDLVILHRRLFNLPSFFFLRRAARKLLYDVDDALFVKDSLQGAETSRTLSARFRRTVAAADRVIAGNAYILGEVRKFTERAAIVPTAIDPSRYATGSKKAGTEGLNAVWIGSVATLFYLEALLPHLEPLVETLPGLELTVISDRFPEKSRIPINRIDWSETDEAGTLCAADVGLMPLYDDAWTRGKCGLKLIQYGAAGIPSVYSPVGVNRTIGVHGETGLRAVMGEEWRQALIQLAGDGEMRNRMGRAARKRIVEHYSIDRCFPGLLEILRESAG